MTLNGIITNEGMQNSILANSNVGWYIIPTRVAVSNVLNPEPLTNSRDSDTVTSVWYSNLLSSKVVQSSNLLQLNFTIPPNSSLTQQQITELYVFAESVPYSVVDISLSTNQVEIDPTLYSYLPNYSGIRFKFLNSGTYPTTSLGQIQSNDVFYIRKLGSNTVELFYDKSSAISNNISNKLDFTVLHSGDLKIVWDYLYSIAQPTSGTTVYYDPESSTQLRLLLNLINLDVGSSFQFPYTQAFEVNDHNNDPNAHPDIQNAINEGGLYVGAINFEYKGQSFFRGSISDYDSLITNNSPVYRNSTDSKFYLAKAVSGEQSKFIGFYKSSDKSIRTNGLIDIGHGFDIGDDIYLSSTIDGGLTNIPTTVYLGLSLGNGVILCRGSNSGYETQSLDNLSDVSITSPIEKHLLMYTQNGWVNTDVQELILYNLLYYSMSYNKNYFNLFNTEYFDFSNSVSMNYVPVNTLYQVGNGSYFETVNLLESGSYKDFKVHIESTVAYTLEYKTSLLGSYTTISSDTNVNISGSFTELYLKVTFSGNGTVSSFGVFYGDLSVAPVPVNSIEVKETNVSINSDVKKFNFTGNVSVSTNLSDPNQVDINVLTSAGVDLTSYALKEEIVYSVISDRIPLSSSVINLLTSNSMTHTGTGSGYDSVNTKYIVDSGDSLVSSELLNPNSTTHFYVYSMGSATYTSEYSVNNGVSWIPFNIDSLLHNPISSTNTLKLKFTFTSSGDFTSFGFYYGNSTPRNNTLSLDNLKDVVISSPTSGQFVMFDGTNFVNSNPNLSLDNLSDVVISSPTNGQLIKYNGTSFVNDTYSLDNLSDVSIISPVTNEYLKYNGSSFVNSTLPDSTTTQKGLIEIATESETLLGINTSKAVVPSTLQAFFNNSNISLLMPTIAYRNFTNTIDIIDDLTAITIYKQRIFTIEYDSTNLFRIRYGETSMKSVTVTLTSYTSYGGSVARIKPDVPFKYYLGYNTTISSTDSYQYMDNIKIVNIQNQNLLFANVYGKLEIFNIEDSSGSLITPTQTGLGSITFTAPNWCVSFEVYGNALYALMSDRTIAVYNLTSLSSPVLVMSNIPSFSPTDYNTTPIYCHNDYMYILSGTSILVYNISNPLSPTYVSIMSSMFTTTTNTANNHLVFVDKYCFLVDFVSSDQRIKNSIKVYDVTNPTLWVLVKTISGNYTTVVKSYLQILLISKPKIEGSTFEIFDLNTMAILGKNYLYSGITYLLSGHLNKIQINDALPHLMSNRTSVRTIDTSHLISYSENFTITGSTGTSSLYTFTGDTSVNNIAISSGYNRNYYTVHDTSISDVQWDESLGAWSVTTTNAIVPDLGVKTGFCDFNTLYVFNHTVSKLYIFSVLQSNASPYISLLSNTSISKNTNYLYLSSGHAVFTNSTQIDIYEVFNKTSISQIRSNLDLTEGQPIVGIKSHDKYMYVWTKSKLYIYDTTDISTFTTPIYSKYILNIVDLDVDPRGWLYIATSNDVSIYSQKLNFVSFIRSGFNLSGGTITISSIQIFGNILRLSSIGEELGNTYYYLIRSVDEISELNIPFSSGASGTVSNSTLSTKCWFYIDSAIYRTGIHSTGSTFVVQASFLSM